MNDDHDNAETDRVMMELLRLRQAVNMERCVVNPDRAESSCLAHRPCGICRLNRRVEHYRQKLIKQHGCTICAAPEVTG
jgi:hypothetical protein